MLSELVTVIQGPVDGFDWTVNQKVPDNEVTWKGRRGSLPSLLVASFVTRNVSWAGAQRILSFDEDLGC